MRFITLIAKNVVHRPVRTVLTTVGLAIAIAAVVILVGISWNFRNSFLAIYRTKGIDLVVVRAGSSNQLSSSLDVHMSDRLRQIEGVVDVSPSLVDTVGFEDKNLVSVLVNGWVPGGILFRGLRLIDGRALREGDQKMVMLGRVLAMTLDKKAGDALQVAGEPFQVAGVYESDSWFENGGMILPLKTLQTMMGREGQVTGFLVQAAASDTSSIAALRRRIEATITGVAAMPARDHVQSDTQIRLARAMAWATAAVALILGSVGMLNTMLMSIFRTDPRNRNLAGGGLATAQGAGTGAGRSPGDRPARDRAGNPAGVLWPQSFDARPHRAGIHRPEPAPGGPGVSPWPWASRLSLLGGLYPAARAAALEPTEARRYE